MKWRIFFSLLLLLTGTIIHGKKATQAFDKPGYYAAMSSDKMDEINAQLVIIKGSSIAEKEAYEGALLMKKAGLVNSAKEKLSLFKAGRSKLESSISKDVNNTEYRFLRVIIQEHAPRIAKYRNELVEDGKMVNTNFKSLPAFLQQVIIDYSKKSKVIKISQA